MGALSAGSNGFNPGGSGPSDAIVAGGFMPM